MKKTIFYLILSFAFLWQGYAQQYFADSFENGGSFPSVWTLDPATGDTWAIDLGDDHGTGTKQDGTYCAFLNDYDYQNGTTAKMITQAIDLSSATAPQLTFYYADGGDNDTVNVLVSTDGTNFTSVFTTPTSTTGWELQTVDLSSYAGQSTVYIAFQGTSVYGSSNPHVDNVVVAEAPACPDPQNLAATPSTSTETVISWDAGSSTTWNLEYGPAGFSQGSGTMVNGLTSPTYTITGLTAGNDYDVYVQADCSSGGNGTSGWVMTTWHQPYSTCSDPVSLTVSPNPNGTPYTLDFATADNVGHFYCDNIGDNNGRWFKFTAPASGRVKMTSSVSGNEFVLLDGCGGSELECGYAHTSHDFSGLTAGADYYIAYWKDAATSGTVDVMLQDVPFVYTMSANPDCANQQFSVDIEVTDLGGASGVTITDDQGSAAQQVTSAPGTVTFGPYASGTTVNFTITSNDDSNSYMTDSFTHTCPPANDACSNATEIASLPYSITENATSATNNDGFITVCSNGMNDGVWFTFVPASDGTVNISAAPDNWDAEIGVYSGTDCSNLTCEGRTDSAGSGGTETMSVTVTAGTKYWINIGYWSSSTDGSEGPFDLNITSSDVTLYVHGLENAGFRLYPNPANNILHIAADKKVDNIRITNISGQTVLEQNINATASQIDISGLPAGVYMLTATVEGQTGTYRLIKE